MCVSLEKKVVLRVETVQVRAILQTIAIVPSPSPAHIQSQFQDFSLGSLVFMLPVVPVVVLAGVKPAP